YVRNNQLKLAEKYLNKMKPYMPDPVQLMVNAGYYMNRGLIFYKQQLYDSALLYYHQAFEVSNRSNHSLNKTASLYYLSGSALKAGKYKLAKKYAHENLLQAENNHSKTGKINALLNLSDYYHAVGNPTEAYTFLSQAA